MKIVLLADSIPPEGKGGAERIAWNSAVALSKAGNEVVVITTTRESATRLIEAEIEGIQVFFIACKYHVRWRSWVSLCNPAVVLEVRKLLLKLQPDVVHAHNVHQYLSYAIMPMVRSLHPTADRPIKGIPLFHTMHDVMAFHYGKLAEGNYKVSPLRQLKEYRFRYNPVRNSIIRAMLSKATMLFAVSDALRSALEQNGIRGVQVLYNGIDERMWKCNHLAVEHFLQKHVLSGKKVILFGGRVSGAKGGDVLVAALLRIVKAVPESVLVIMGTENTYIQTLKAKAAEDRIGEHILSTGWIEGEELVAMYHAAEVVVVPSLYLDPLPTVVLEAMACAKPVVGSCLGGIPEMVVDSETGYVVHPRETRILADRIIELLQNKEKAIQYGSAGAKRQSEKFSEEIQTRVLISEYEKVLGK